MSRIMDHLRGTERSRVRLKPRSRPGPEDWTARDLRVVTVTSNKGGVGKTTLATNLAVYIRALREDLPILVVGLDDQTMVDRMFALEPGDPDQTVADALRAGSFESAARLGQFGIHYVPTSSRISELKSEIRDPFPLQEVLLRTGWRGLVVIDTKSDLEILTQNAIAASDLAVVVVQDESSLIEAQKVYELLAELKLPRERARILLSLVDLRIKFRSGANGDVLALLVSEVRRRGFPLFETFVSRSPKIESLYTNPEGRALSILHGAEGSVVHRQMRHLAHDVFCSLYPMAPEAEELPKATHSVLLEALTPEAMIALPTNPYEIKRFPFSIGREHPDVPNDLTIPDSFPWQVSRRHAALVEWDGQVAVVDRGSKLGTLVNGWRLGGENGEIGSILLTEGIGSLVLGTSNSPIRFSLVVRRGETGRGVPTSDNTELRQVASQVRGGGERVGQTSGAIAVRGRPKGLGLVAGRTVAGNGHETP